MHNDNAGIGAAAAPQPYERFAKAIAEIGNDQSGRSIRSSGSQLDNPMRENSIKAELDAAETLLGEAYRLFDQIAIAAVGIAPESSESKFPGGDGIADRATRIRLRLNELVPLMNVLQQRMS